MLTRFFLFFICGAVLFGLSSEGRASAACDTDFRDALKARAWMVAKREVETAETLILKPDSVLEYTCFLDDANHMAQSTGSTHLSSNFPGKYLAGLHSGSGTCIDMAKIWEFFKCQDFDPGTFKSFQTIKGADPRKNPACSEPNRSSKWSSNVAASGSYSADAVLTYLSKTTWLRVLKCTLEKPVPTGLMAEEGGTLYEDKVCLVPGCHFDPVNLTTKSDDKCR